MSEIPPGFERDSGAHVAFLGIETCSCLSDLTHGLTFWEVPSPLWV